ncbi:hypothetical protein GCM10010518_26180 [Kitasatospora cinereorecta]
MRRWCPDTLTRAIDFRPLTSWRAYTAGRRRPVPEGGPELDCPCAGRMPTPDSPPCRADPQVTQAAVPERRIQDADREVDAAGSFVEEENHSLPLSIYSPTGALRQGPRRAAE